MAASQHTRIRSRRRSPGAKGHAEGQGVVEAEVAIGPATAKCSTQEMTEHEIILAVSLGRCAGGVGSRFMRDLVAAATNKPDTELTLRQRHYMEILAWRYRAPPFRLDVELEKLHRALHPRACNCVVFHYPGCPFANVVIS